MASRERLDRLLVQRGFCETQARAQALILAGKVVVDDHAAEKAGALIAVSADIRVKGAEHPFVSRGGIKLRTALDTFGELHVRDAVALDVGASTGGFTDCLLQAGVKRVHAVDVGYGQLAWKLAQDPRVIVHDRQNIRDLAPAKLGEAIDLVVADCSFISLTKVLPALPPHLKSCAQVVALIKPQFEVARNELDPGGIVRDTNARDHALTLVKSAAQDLGLELRGICAAAIAGQDGNQEYLAWWTWEPSFKR